MSYPTNTSDIEVPFLKISGSPKEMGLTHGETYRNLIGTLFEIRHELLLKGAKGSDENKIEDIAYSFWKYISNFDKPLAIELESTAKAANILPWKLVVAGGFTDLMDALSTTIHPDYHECTVAIDPAKGFIAGTWDSHPEAGEALILLERHPNNGPATLALTTAGWPCQQGLNSYGVGFAITNLTPNKSSKHGLVYIAANAFLGTAQSTSHILNQLKTETYCSGHSYIVLDRTGSGAIMETTNTTTNILQINSLTTKANHYLSGPQSIDNNSNYLYYDYSISREKELHENISQMANAQDFPSCLFNSQKVNRTDSSQVAITCAHFLISVIDNTIWYAKGPALPPLKYQMLSKTLSDE
ncbi:putative choloylglycine hydrolase (plasmid) [Desulfocapsa sulfexigens DSM 10523]|uniref:Putative choloylglycine hydrolase n=1 Tax=Desulfocapsa sulfexigens (strain DSM 10523 / SB164P1) TaxID=1167006 RepID=M1PKR1_DESSD|nr:C45 family peptidase [Desulfocapsa sulfexigens]AGF80095.1 putative choloylglycine hydrolase [Desulfocapsa sulfexigens DSM 10523]